MRRAGGWLAGGVAVFLVLAGGVVSAMKESSDQAVTFSSKPVVTTVLADAEPSSVPASTYAVEGYVQNSITGLPLPGVSVSLGTTTVTTDPAGEYRFSNQSNGSIKLSLSMAGYSNKELDLTIQNQNIVTPIVSLVPAGQAVYVATTNGRRQVYTVGYDGQNPRPLTQASGESYAPVVSPNGDLIVYSSTQDGAKDAYGYPEAKLYLSGIDGQNPQRLSDTAAQSFTVLWSPNNQWIYVATQGFYQAYDLETGTWTDLGETAEGAVFSPDGVTLAYYVYGTDASSGAVVNYLKTINLASGTRMTVTERTAYPSDLRFSPDGKSLSYQVTVSGVRQGYEDTLAVAGSEQEVALLDSGTRSYSPSPDGSLQAFVEARSGKTDLYVVDQNLQNERQLTITGDLDPTYLPSWDPSGQYLVFAAQGSLYVVSAEAGTAPRKLVTYT